MARRQRPYSVITQQASVDLANTTGEVALTMRPPSPGASIDHAYFVVTTIGAVSTSGTQTISIEDNANSVTLTGFASFQASAATNTVIELEGNTGNYCPTGGEDLVIQMTETGTVTNGSIGTLTIWWNT